MVIHNDTNKSVFSFSKANSFLKKEFSVAGLNNYSNIHKSHNVDNACRSEQIRNLSKLPESDKVKEATKAYSAMQSTLLWRIMDEQNKIKYFNERKEKISYYTKLLEGDDINNVIVVDEKRYELSEKYQDTNLIKREVIEGYLDDATEALNRMVEPVDESDTRFHNFRNVTLQSVFRNSAADFAAVTGMSADCLNIEDDNSLLWRANDRTVENYVRKAEETIAKLKARSNGLYQLMQDYKKSIRKSNFEDLFDTTSNYKMKELEEIRQQFLQTGQLSYSDKKFSLFSTLA